MCCEAKVKKTNKFLEKHKDKDWIYCYKILDEDNFSPYFNLLYEIGIVTSGPDIFPLIKTCQDINIGIHVYTDLQEAKNETWTRDKIIRVKCYLKDLIGVGDFDGSLTAVFNKVEVESLDAIE